MPDTYCPECDKRGVTLDKRGAHVKCGLTLEEARGNMFREARAMRQEADRLIRAAQERERLARKQVAP